MYLIMFIHATTHSHYTFTQMSPVQYLVVYNAWLSTVQRQCQHLQAERTTQINVCILGVPVIILLLFNVNWLDWRCTFSFIRHHLFGFYQVKIKLDLYPYPWIQELREPKSVVLTLKYHRVPRLSKCLYI